MGQGETSNRIAQLKAVEGGAEKAGKELDSAALDEQDREVAQQAFEAILQLGIAYTAEKPDNAKKLGSEKMLTVLTKSTFKTLEESGTLLTPEQKSAVEGMVKDFLSKMGEGQRTAKIDLGQGDDRQEKAPQFVQPETAIDAKQSPSAKEQIKKADLSVVKDKFEYMDALSDLQGQLSGNKEHDKPIKEQITALNVANLLYEFNIKGVEPKLNGSISAGGSNIQLTSSGDIITANVDNQFAFQYSRAFIKKQLEIR
jgi:hypothetical protein